MLRLIVDCISSIQRFYPGLYRFWNLIDIFKFAVTIVAYGAMDSQFDESSDNSVLVSDFAGRTITFDSITLGMRSIYMIR